MSLQFANFSRATLSGTHSDTTTTFNLQGVEGIRFPFNPPYRCVVWNFTDYPDPVDARWAIPAQAEIIEVGNPTLANQLTGCTRNVEGVGAVAFDDPDKEYRIMHVVTAGYLNTSINPDGDTTFWSGTLGGTVFDDAAQMRLTHAAFAADNMLVSLQGGTSASLVGLRMKDNAGNGTAGLVNNITTGDLTLTAFTRLIVDSATSRFDGLFGLGGGANLEIATGAITVTHSFHRVDSAGGSGADDLDTINGGADGDILILQSLNSANDVTVRDGVGNIVCGANRIMDTVNDLIMLKRTGSTWYQLAWNDNG